MKAKIYYIGKTDVDTTSFKDPQIGLYEEVEDVEEITDRGGADFVICSKGPHFLRTFDSSLFRIELVGDEEQLSLLSILKSNSYLYGNKVQILDIISANDNYCIRYFEKALSEMFTGSAAINRKYFDVKFEGKGDVSSTTLKSSGFNLTKEQFLNIHEYIIPRVVKNVYYDRYELNHVDSTTILHYIDGTITSLIL